MLTLVLATGVIASVCALMAAYTYLRRGRDPSAAARGARRWLVGVAIFGISAVVLRFVWVLLS
ncbi:hypothetical protein NWF34_15060 [Gordonia sp. GONU]|uniref:hypothetical protein n=1 Tax=Gordonia sp. GONU TaxID=2972949 RepID=UPI0021AD1B79|nr:hypothetical protein [Gordonia sp. GONU]MCR8898266.1 hypothetical protein [Gordonia sp. GONU]